MSQKVIQKLSIRATQRSLSLSLSFSLSLSRLYRQSRCSDENKYTGGSQDTHRWRPINPSLLGEGFLARIRSSVAARKAQRWIYNSMTR